MKEILPEVGRWLEEGESVVVATVVATRRSAPRPVGSSLAVSSSGAICGSVSGGCVETDVYEKAHDLLEQADFLDRKDVQVRNLSHGEQRQLEIVVGLASDPKILLLDEPAAGLSSGESQEMTKFLGRLDPNLAILLIEHDMDVVFDVADHISVLHFGEVLETGAAEQIRGSAKVREVYLGTA